MKAIIERIIIEFKKDIFIRLIVAGLVIPTLFFLGSLVAIYLKINLSVFPQNTVVALLYIFSASVYFAVIYIPLAKGLRNIKTTRAKVLVAIWLLISFVVLIVWARAASTEMAAAHDFTWYFFQGFAICYVLIGVGVPILLINNILGKSKENNIKVISTAVLIIIALLIGFYFGRSTFKIKNTPYHFGNYEDYISAWGTLNAKDEYGFNLVGKDDPTGVSGRSVDLRCYKSTMICEENQGFIESDPANGSYISIGYPKNYEIDEWTNNSVTTKPLVLDSCTNETLNIDRISKTVTTINQLSSKNGNCSSVPSGKVIITIQ